MPHLRRELLGRTERSTLSMSHVLRRKRRKWAISRRRQPRPQQCMRIARSAAYVMGAAALVAVLALIIKALWH